MNLLSSALAVIAVTSVGPAVLASQEVVLQSPAEVWKSLKSPGEGLQEADGWTFSVASVRPVNRSDDALELAFEKARFDAMVRLARTCFDPVQIIGSLKPAPAGRLTEQAVFIARDRVSLAGVQAIETGVTPRGEARVVMAIPTRTLDAQRLSTPDVLESLSARAQSDGLPLQQAMLWCELATSEKRAAAREELARALGREVGEGVAQTLRGEPLRCLSAGWKSLPRPLSEGALGKATLDMALAALARRPHDPTVAGFIASRLQEDGWPECANAFLDSPELVRWMSVPKEAGDPPIALTSPICRLLIETSGGFPFSGESVATGDQESTIPAEAISLFNRGKPAEAGRVLVEASPDCPDADWLSYLSACLFQVGMDVEAALMAEVAFKMEPEHPFAGINALRPLCRMGQLDQARELLASVELRASLNAWGRRELEALRLVLHPPPPSLEPADPIAEVPADDDGTRAEEQEPSVSSSPD